MIGRMTTTIPLWQNILKDLQPELLRTENFFDEDYEEERATGYKGICTEEE